MLYHHLKVWADGKSRFQRKFLPKKGDCGNRDLIVILQP